MGSRRRSSRKRSRSGVAILFSGIFVLAVLAVAAAGSMILTPFGPSGETLVQIAPGSSTMRVARQLEEAGVLRSRYEFYVLRWLKRGVLKAGAYKFDHPAPATEIYSRIVRGDVYTIALTVPEGANIFDIAARVEQAGLGRKGDFLQAAADRTSLVADLDPGAKSLEGYLFPDTYRFSPPVSAEQMVAAMVRQFRVAAEQIGLRENVHEVVTLASLVEHETALEAERPLVASVYANRLEKKMPLAADPSIIYGLQLQGRYRGTIYESDLQSNMAYNTYRHAGLPPGPIASPGLPSLKAALHPAQTNYLYFVAAGNNPQGHSLFSATLNEQIRNVAEYRKAMRQAGAR
jgi:UPF0755 protein